MKISDLIATENPVLGPLVPWLATTDAIAIVTAMIGETTGDFVCDAGNAIHTSAVIEPGAILKAPCLIGPNCFVAAGAYLRGGVWLERDVIIGPGCEIKSSFIFAGSKTAHFNFVGDSIIGNQVNIEAGAIIANYRNERADKAIWFHYKDAVIKTGVDKFGAIVGDHCRIGANAVIAPGAALNPHTIVKRLELLDQA
jgi:UDP-N-acetylglucosamine diphosphorylase / glucose-1-phosphate thymidylyltransferase / UDP-N-acetylgalactosamine diphosphorylase / glucosamine-1-phosphate N-acetyltransferase / galactosamine-1-phosphate N-acetyltransferase